MVATIDRAFSSSPDSGFAGSPRAIPSTSTSSRKRFLGSRRGRKRPRLSPAFALMNCRVRSGMEEDCRHKSNSDWSLGKRGDASVAARSSWIAEMVGTETGKRRGFFLAPVSPSFDRPSVEFRESASFAGEMRAASTATNAVGYRVSGATKLLGCHPEEND